MKYYLLLCLTISFSSLTAQQDPDLLITYKSDFEKLVLSDSDKASDLELLLAITEDMDQQKVNQVNERINSLKADLMAKKFNNKKEDKKIKLLFNLTHEKFFRKYQEISNFSNIFDINEYNCVSATALYTYLLSDYRIPFLIKEEPTHVYAIAYPDTRNILLESTAPGTGYYSPGSGDIQKAVSSLVQMKYVTQNEVAAKGHMKVYEEFFFNGENITIKKLAGLQYYNEAISFITQENYKEAYNAASKGEILYPSKKIDYLKYVTLSSILANSKYDNHQDIRYFAALANSRKDESSTVTNNYQAIIYQQLFNAGNKTFTDSVFNYLNVSLTDKQLLNKIAERHHGMYADYYNKKSNTVKALEHAALAYNINPENVITQGLITNSITSRFVMSKGSTTTINQMDDYKKQFPFLENNSLYLSLYVYNYSFIAYQNFSADNITDGLKYLELMEQLRMANGEALRIEENQYSLVFAEAGAAYFRKRQYAKAKGIIERGLKIFPDNPELKVRLQIVHDEMRK